MTRFQARYIQYLTLIGYSLRATAGNYYGRYNKDGSNKGLPNNYKGFGGNQMDGIALRERAIEKLLELGIDPVIGIMDNNIGYDDDSYRVWRRKIKQNDNLR